jgi:hypothetical protein
VTVPSEGGVLWRAVDREGGALKLSSLPLVWALRDGGEACLPAEELVPGDIIILTKGDMVRHRHHHHHAYHHHDVTIIGHITQPPTSRVISMHMWS